MNEFVLTVNGESAKVQTCLSLKEVVELLHMRGCQFVAPAAPKKEPEEHERMGLSYGEWFRRYVSDW